MLAKAPVLQGLLFCQRFDNALLKVRYRVLVGGLVGGLDLRQERGSRWFELRSGAFSLACDESASGEKWYLISSM